MKTTCIIVEDEPLAMERTTNFITKTNALQLVASFYNAIDAANFLRNNKVDLIFLDINLGQVSGLDLLEQLELKCNVIITTAYPDYALKGFDLNVTDYLLKPFTIERFHQAILKVKQAAPQIENLNDLYFFVKTENRFEKIFYHEVVYIEGMRDYRKIHTTTKKIMTLQTFTDLEKELPQSLICRVHKSYMVGVSKINSVKYNKIILNEIEIPISDTYKDSFLKIITK